MSNTFLLKLVQISDNVAKVFSNGEVAGYIALPENEHQNPRPFAITHNGKDICYAHCEGCAIEAVVRHFERIPEPIEIDLVAPNEVTMSVSISTPSIH